MSGHCAKFSDALLPVAGDMLERALSTIKTPTAFDPFAGTGKGVDFMRALGLIAFGIELEPEFIASEFVNQGTALALPYATASFDACFTSPTYGNRMADKDLRPSVAGTYAKSLGRHASEGSSCHLQWGPDYRDFHFEAWAEVARVLKLGGVLLLNMKDHPRVFETQRVTEWHVQKLELLGFAVEEWKHVPTPGNRRGANKETAILFESLVLLRKVS